MQSPNKRPDYRVEFKNFPNGDLEIRYFDLPQDSFYRSWKLPKEVVKDLNAWWKKIKKNRNKHFPVKMKTKICEFTMYTEKSVEIREFDSLGRHKVVGWSLPNVVVEELIDWDNRRLISYECEER